MEQQLDKLNRTDLIKLIGEQVLAELAGEVDRVRGARDEAVALFNQRVTELGRAAHSTLLINMLAVAGRPEDALRGVVVTRILPETEVPSVATVVFTDSAMTFDASMKLTVHVPIDGKLRVLAEQILALHRDVAEAEVRDTRVSTIRENVRKDLVAELLKEPEGAEVLDAAKRLARAVKARLEGGGHTPAR